MQVTVSARHTEVSPALRAAVVEKVTRLERFFAGMERAEVHFDEEHNRRINDREICEVLMVGHGQTVRCRVTAPDGFAAIDRAIDKLEQQLYKLKTKNENRYHGGNKKQPKVVPAPSMA